MHFQCLRQALGKRRVSLGREVYPVEGQNNVKEKENASLGGGQPGQMTSSLMPHQMRFQSPPWAVEAVARRLLLPMPHQQ